MSGPYEAEHEATIDVRDVYAGYHKRGVMEAKTLDRLLGFCSEHGLEVGAYDWEVLQWIARQKPEAAQVIVGLVYRATAAANREPITHH
jgi:hypothetical protein